MFKILPILNVRATKQFKYHISAGPEQSLDLASCI